AKAYTLELATKCRKAHLAWLAAQSFGPAPTPAGRSDMTSIKTGIFVTANNLQRQKPYVCGMMSPAVSLTILAQCAPIDPGGIDRNRSLPDRCTARECH